MGTRSRSSQQQSNGNTAVNRWWKAIRPFIFGLGLIVVLSAILVFDFFTVPQITLKVDDTAPEDVLAPRSITYISEILTERARREAVDNVLDIYNPPDMRVARNQVSHSRQVLDFIETVRADTLAGSQRQKKYIHAVPNLDLHPDILTKLFDFNATEWETVRRDTLDVVDQAMREQIRPDRLEEVQAAVPLLVKLERSEKEAMVITALAQNLIVPNSTFSQQLTEQAVQQAAASVEPVRQSFDINSTIVHQGDAIDSADIEAMQQFGLMKTEVNWKAGISPLVAVILVISLLALYISRFFPRFLTSGRHLTMISSLLILFTLIAKLIVPGRAIIPFLYPAAGLSMLLTVLFDPNLAIAVTICQAALVGLIGGNSLELMVFSAVGGVIAALCIRKSPRISAFFRTGLIVAVANVGVILIYRVNSSDLLGIVQLVGASLLNGIFSAGITLAGFFVVGNVFNVVTSLQLQELARLDHPLLQELLRQAPGTYHHSLMVANLAEQAARRIGADADLVRVGSFYHDVGKIARPYFFTENQDGVNAHSRLDPLTSSQTIANHVKDGLDLAKRFRLPEKIRSFIPEHQGTRTIRYFYDCALKNADDPSLINENDFKYPGPKPQSKETAIVLLADACEAASTAFQNSSDKKMQKVVRGIIDEIILEGELDESGLTLNDVHRIKQSFVESLQGRFHVRPKYPGQQTSDQLDAPKKESNQAQNGEITKPTTKIQENKDEEEE